MHIMNTELNAGKQETEWLSYAQLPSKACHFSHALGDFSSH